MEARFDLENCNHEQRRFVLSLGELLCADHGAAFKRVLQGQSVIGTKPGGQAVELRNLNPLHLASRAAALVQTGGGQ